VQFIRHALGGVEVVTSLRPVAEDDQAHIQRWAGFAAGYMSRTHPLDVAADRHAPGEGLYWYVIVADGRDVGTVWVELPPGASEAVLGVFLCDEAHLGRGIGTAAVSLALAEFRGAHPGLPVALRVRRTNERAIACYRRAGFTLTGSGTKSLPSGMHVPYYSMVSTPC
jgi:RimJ/RimL family protein N-acetyltransferase